MQLCFKKIYQYFSDRGLKQDMFCSKPKQVSSLVYNVNVFAVFRLAMGEAIRMRPGQFQNRKYDVYIIYSICSRKSEFKGLSVQY